MPTYYLKHRNERITCADTRKTKTCGKTNLTQQDLTDKAFTYTCNDKACSAYTQPITISLIPGTFVEE